MIIKEITLENGLTVWLNEDHTQPVVNGCVVVKSGAKDTPNTGIAHYFEHIMFKGTDKIGTIDYVKEKPILDKIAQKYDQLYETKEPQKRIKIQQEINQLSIEAAQYAIPNEFNNLISQYGGTKLNAATGLDTTIYFNTFSPTFLEQWCALNSERLIHPVFRLFQSELETVYEEKNMYVDTVGQMAFEKTLERFFAPHPYGYPIIGSTENIKNPNLAAMKDFYEKHYVAGNMGLILTGDFETSHAMPIISRYFGLIKAGEVKKETLPSPKPFNGKEHFKAKLPIPFVKASAMLWRGIHTAHTDEIAMKILMSIFTNENKSGLLDELTIEGKLMQAMGMSLSMNDAGAIALLAVPNIPFQTNRSAKKHLLDAIEKVKNGTFSEELFQNLKMEIKRNELKDIENIDNRLQKMIAIFSSGKKWDEYLESVAKIDKLTKDDIVSVANTYLTDNYLEVKKKTGRYKGQKIKKPSFEPIVCTHSDATSVYAQSLKTINRYDRPSRFLDFETDTTNILLPINNNVSFYHTPNPINELFDLELIYEVGREKIPTAGHIATYLNYVGTNQYSIKEFNQRLQAIGATLDFVASDSTFKISISGIESYIEATLQLVGHFLENVKADETKFKKITDEKKIEDKAQQKSSEAIADAAYQYVKFGEKSFYLTSLSHKELKKLSGKQLLQDLEKIQTYQAQIHYCGTTDIHTIVHLIEDTLPIKQINQPTENPRYKIPRQYDQATLHFVHDGKATQSTIYGFMTLPIVVDDLDEKNLYKLFNTYLGGGMGSVLFQEIREYRSLAYRASSWLIQPPPQHANQPASLNVILSTQADKTPYALQALHTLLKDVPMSQKRLENAKQTQINTARNAYPNFRKISKAIATYKTHGYTEDPNRLWIEKTEKLQLEIISKAYQNNIQGRPMTYIITGNKNKIDLQALEKIGKINIIKKKNIFH